EVTADFHAERRGTAPSPGPAAAAGTPVADGHSFGDGNAAPAQAAGNKIGVLATEEFARVLKDFFVVCEGLTYISFPTNPYLTDARPTAELKGAKIYYLGDRLTPADGANG